MSSTITPRVAENDEAKEVPHRAFDCAGVSWVDYLAPSETICVMMGKPRNSSDDVDMEIKSELVSELIVQSPTINCRSLSVGIAENCTEQTVADPTAVNNQIVTTRKISTSLQASEDQGFDTSLADYFDDDDSQTDDMSELRILSYTSLATNQTVVVANSNPIPQSQPEEKDDDDEVEIVSFTAPNICLSCNNRLKRKKACECDLFNKFIKSEPPSSSSKRSGLSSRAVGR